MPDSAATFDNAELAEKVNAGCDVRLDDFYAYMPTHQYIFVPTRELWPASSVNQRVSTGDPKVKASDYLDQHRAVEQMTWAPGLGELVRGRLIDAGGWIDRPGCSTFNLYRPPSPLRGNAGDVDLWLTHVIKMYPNEADHVLDWLAHRVQRPAEKINHALVLIGAQGIGKDTILEPVKYAVGPWNFSDVSPAHILGRFNGYIKSVVLRVSEARDLGDADRYTFYEHTKPLLASPPDVLRCDEKNLREYAVLNCSGVIITSNHKTAGIYLPADDRRHFVAYSHLQKEEFDLAYWKQLWAWYGQTGFCNIAAYLRARDLGRFDAKAPPLKTSAWHEIVSASRAPEDSDMADMIELCGHPPAITLQKIIDTARSNYRGDFVDYLTDRKVKRVIPHRFEEAGYVRVNNRDAKDGEWKINGRRQAVYARRELIERDQIVAARTLTA